MGTVLYSVRYNPQYSDTGEDMPPHKNYSVAVLHWSGDNKLGKKKYALSFHLVVGLISLLLFLGYSFCHWPPDRDYTVLTRLSGWELPNV
ncbi:hypothetical protein NEOLEDRAFT_1102552 [Neolentinus lepideus HHB14362 ss-1]|uniref:Uncharacterized protein n=1 Tax=Neolentinus lepideus HHB14362 ss-1 TaxID=1314782 RepID=A0A165N594_9AGAM|nr:hypothetical protein NEOLEDRAFT_1102552 [Neolentinus lepideus HHB14362 ss-1]